MATLAQRLMAREAPGEKRFGLSELAQWISVANSGGSFPSTTWSKSGEESLPDSFESFVGQLFKADPVVFAAVSTRMAVFSQARLQWLRRRTGQPDEMFGDRSLRLFERPWPGGTTSDLLGRMLLSADLAGNAYVWNSGNRLHVLRPDWVSIVLGSDRETDNPEWGEDVEVLGYTYRPGGQMTGRSRFLMPDEVAHFAPQSDPSAHFRGMSWLTPVIREIQGDKAMTEHKLKFLENAATPNMVIKFDASQTREQVKEFKELMESEHQGYLNAYKNLYLGGGADATVVGADFEQLDFSAVQGKAETRIAMASGVHPTLLGASEGMQGSSLNAGNYGQIKRQLSDIRLQHLWGNAAASLESLVRPPDGAELTVDTSGIPFLQDDMKDTAEIQANQAAAMRQLLDGGMDPESIKQWIVTDDVSVLKHTGKLSVQLQAPGAGEDT